MKATQNYTGDYTSPQFNDKIKEIRGVIITCGSCEQHGHHLPLDTDNIIGMEIALRIAEKTNMLVMPPINYGQVWSAKGFPGTISLTPNTLKSLLREIVCSLETQNVKNIVLMSGHNGNYPVLKDFAREMLDEFGWDNIWHFPLAMSKDLVDRAKSPQSYCIHAGEIETAMLMYLRPELVDHSKVTKEFPQPPADYAYRPIHWKEFVESGSFGDSSAATAEFGKALIDYAVNTTSDLINQLVS